MGRRESEGLEVGPARHREAGRVREGRLKRNYAKLKEGDLVVGYQSTPDKRVVALARVTGEFRDRGGEKPGIEVGDYVAVQDG